MNEKEQIGENAHKRLLGSVSTYNKRKRRSRLRWSLGLAMGFLLIGSSLYFGKLDIFNSKNARHLVADFTSGQLTISNQQPIDISSIKESADNLPVSILRESNRMVIRTKNNLLAKDDSISIHVDKGGFYQVEFDDGTVAYLNSQTTLTYRGDFLEDRKISLDGEAYFEVKSLYKADKRQPFTIYTNNQKVEVLGTSFNVKTRDQQEESVVLIEGKVQLQPHKNKHQTVLRPGEKASISSSGKIKVEPTDTELYTAWKDGYFYYQDTLLKDILEDLKNYYEIKYDPDKIPKLRYTLYLDRALPFSQVIEYIEESSTIKIETHGKRIIFKN